MNTASQVAQFRESGLHLAGGMLEQIGRLRRWTRDGLCHPHVEHGIHESLLRSVVQVAFDPPALLILCGDDPRAGFAQLLEQPEPAEHQTGLRREVADKTNLRRCEVFAARLSHHKRAQFLVLVEYRHNGAGRSGTCGDVVGIGERLRSRRGRRRRGEPQPLSDPHPNLDERRSGTVAHELSHARQ